MPTEFSRQAILSISLNNLFAILQDQRYWSDRTNYINSTSKITSFDINDKKLKIDISNHIPPENLPDAIRLARPTGITIVRNELWTKNPDNISAEFTAQVQEASATLTGISVITENEQGFCSLTTHGQAVVNIPIFGKKIENGVIDNINTLLDHELDFTLKWIAQISA